MRILILSGILAILPLCDLFSQSLSRSVICSLGTQSSEGGVIVRQTVGQPSNTLTFTQGQLLLRQGFQQPSLNSKNPIVKTISFKLFPNPAFDKTNIQVQDLEENYSIFIYNTTGELVKSIQEISDKIYPIDILGLKSGVYLLKVISDDLTGVEKLFITQNPTR